MLFYLGKRGAEAFGYGFQRFGIVPLGWQVRGFDIGIHVQIPDARKPVFFFWCWVWAWFGDQLVGGTRNARYFEVMSLKV